MPYSYKKTAYELVREAAHNLGRDGRSFHYSEVVDYIRTHYPDCPFKDNTIYLHLRGLSKNIESSKQHHPSLYKRAFLLYLGNRRFKLVEESGIEQFETDEDMGDREDPEAIAKEVMERYFGVKLEKKKLNIFGKYKEFDLVNVQEAIVGDVKHYTFKGSNPAAQFSTISEYIWLMRNLSNRAGESGRSLLWDSVIKTRLRSMPSNTVPGLVTLKSTS